MKKWSIALAVGAAPMILWAFSLGPNPGVSGVPGEGTCADTFCHVGTAVGSSMTITAEGGPAYTPGIAKTITVTITDTNTRYGFQSTARLASDAKAQAGSLSTTDATLLILCSSLDLLDQQTKPAAGCPPNRPLEYISHRSPRMTGTFTFTFTPAASATGDVILYAAGNAANGNGTNSGDRIHTATLRLSPAAPNRPSISSGGAVTVVNFGGSTVVAPQSWMEIYGTDLAPSTADWSSAIASGTAPTTLNGVEVTIGGSPAFLSFVSPGQVNVQVPDGIGVGPTVLTVRTAAGTSDNYNLNVASVTNSFLAPPIAPFRVGDRQFIAALFSDSTVSGPFVGSPSESASFRSARPGDRIILYAVGLGPVNPPQEAGKVVTQSTALQSVTLQFGLAPVLLEYAGLAPNSVGLFQLNAVVPNVPPGEYPLGGIINGVPIPSGLFINLK
jgi:uncharacterized protein (TIGR03437 family)